MITIARGRSKISKSYMSVRFIDGLLILVAIVGAYFAWSVQDQAGRFQAMRLELERTIGPMPVSDPTKYHVMLLDSDNPLRFRWRVYIPAKMDTTLLVSRKTPTGSSGTTSQAFSRNTSQAFEGVVTALIEPGEGKGDMHIRVQSQGFNSRGAANANWNNEDIQEMAKNGDTSTWKIAGRNGVETIDADDPIWLLDLTSPANGPKETAKAFIALGSEDALEKAKSK